MSVDLLPDYHERKSELQNLSKLRKRFKERLRFCFILFIQVWKLKNNKVKVPCSLILWKTCSTIEHLTPLNVHFSLLKLSPLYSLKFSVIRTLDSVWSWRETKSKRYSFYSHNSRWSLPMTLTILLRHSHLVKPVSFTSDITYFLY